MKIAIIGSGISGLGSLYHLSKEHTIDLYEVDKRLGGHTETHTVKIKDRYINIDTCLLYTSPSPRDVEESRMPSSA